MNIEHHLTIHHHAEVGYAFAFQRRDYLFEAGSHDAVPIQPNDVALDLNSLGLGHPNRRHIALLFDLDGTSSLEQAQQADQTAG